MIENLHKIGVRVLAERPVSATSAELIKILHSWIQTNALPGVLLDVADYSHVTNGPGILLVSHEGNWSIKVDGQDPSVSYTSKVSGAESLSARITKVARDAIKAASLLEQDERLSGQIRFRTDELVVFANDRLIAPNDDQTFEQFRTPLEQGLTKLYSTGSPTMKRLGESPNRFTVSLQGSFGTSLRESLAKLDG